MTLLSWCCGDSLVAGESDEASKLRIPTAPLGVRGGGGADELRKNNASASESIIPVAIAIEASNEEERTRSENDWNKSTYALAVPTVNELPTENVVEERVEVLTAVPDISLADWEETDSKTTTDAEELDAMSSPPNHNANWHNNPRQLSSVVSEGGNEFGTEIIVLDFEQMICTDRPRTNSTGSHTNDPLLELEEPFGGDQDTDAEEEQEDRDLPTLEDCDNARDGVATVDQDSSSTAEVGQDVGLQGSAARAVTALVDAELEEYDPSQTYKEVMGIDSNSHDDSASRLQPLLGSLDEAPDVLKESNCLTEVESDGDATKPLNDKTDGEEPPRTGAEPTQVSVSIDFKREDEAMEDLIVISFSNEVAPIAQFQTVVPDVASTTTTDDGRQSTTQRVRSLLRGLYEEEKKEEPDETFAISSDRESLPFVHRVRNSKVQRAVQRLEKDVALHRDACNRRANNKRDLRRVQSTDVRHSDLSRGETSPVDTFDDNEASLSDYRTKTDPPLACRLILRLVSDSDSSSSEESSTSVSGSFILSVSATDQSDSRRRSADVQSIEHLFRQLKFTESRQRIGELQASNNRIRSVSVGENRRARSKASERAERMQELTGKQIMIPDQREQDRLREDYLRLEKEMKQHNTAVILTELYREEREKEEEKFEADNRDENLQALKKIRRCMPVNVRSMSESSLLRVKTPSGRTLPTAMVRKFKQTTVLQLLRIDPRDIERFHPSVLEDLRLIDLTLIERRALHYHLESLGPKWEDKKAGLYSERKWAWHEMMKNNFKEELSLFTCFRENLREKDCNNLKDANEVTSNLVARGTGSSMLDPEFNIDYSEDYGYPDGAEYEVLPSGSEELEGFSLTVQKLMASIISAKLESDSQSSTSDEDESKTMELDEDQDSAIDMLSPVLQRVRELKDQSAQAREIFESLEKSMVNLDSTSRNEIDL